MLKTEIEYWLALKFVPRLATQKKISLVNKYGLTQLFESPNTLLTYPLSSSQKSAFIQPDWEKIHHIIVMSTACGSQIIPFNDSSYPQLLQEIYDPPLVLFVQGNKKLLNQPQMAIVGSRSATIDGRDNAFKFSKALVQSGFVVTSGLAVGIDAAAHRGAISYNGCTIAVVATGLDKTYPTRHKPLAIEIIDAGGAIVSEFIPGTPPSAGHFPKRNRIISGLSQGVLVVEAEIRSGSLITARCAIEQNREVYALPGSISNPLSKGCHWLIKQGAKLVDEYADIITEFGDDVNKHDIEYGRTVKIENICQEDLFNDSLLASVGYEVTPIDMVVSRSKLPVEEVLTRLTILELKGLITTAPGGYLRLNRG